MNIILTEEWIDVSHSIGVPLGGLGTGYVVFGKYGFIRTNFKGWPDVHNYDFDTPEHLWSYSNPPSKDSYSEFGFFLDYKGKRIALQETSPFWCTDTEVCDHVFSSAYLPKSFFKFDIKNLPLQIQANVFNPLLPHDLELSSTPILIFDFTINNNGSTSETATLRLLNNVSGEFIEKYWISKNNDGEICWFTENGFTEDHGVGKEVTIPPYSSVSIRFHFSWYYPEFKHITTAKRYYSRSYSGAADIINKSIIDADSWSNKIDTWHNSICAPVYLKRLWFSSLSSVIASTMLGDEPSFYEIETPHLFLNTMDVSCYSSWIYMINWPQLELMDMNQYLSILETEGERAGYVWHSMVRDEADYVEEPCFIERVCRDFLWFNDQEWACKAFEYLERSAQRVYKAAGYNYLINSPHGNQSYDLWKMPGISAYVNSSWIYALHGFSKMSHALGKHVNIGSIPIEQFTINAISKFDTLLWNKEGSYWNCFYRTPDANLKGKPESVFTDQLFGKWMLGIDFSSNELLPSEKISSALKAIFDNNLIIDQKNDFKGWVNGMLPDRKIDTSGFHSYTCWFGAQFNLASLLASSGQEKESLEIMKSVEKSLDNNHLAAGEWNRAVTTDLTVERLKGEPGKDTPRFPPYPRYKSCWEYILRIIGLQMDHTYFHLDPFKSIHFSIDSAILAGTEFTISIEPDWNCVYLNGALKELPFKFKRSYKQCKIEFRKE